MARGAPWTGRQKNVERQEETLRRSDLLQAGNGYMPMGSIPRMSEPLLV